MYLFHLFYLFEVFYYLYFFYLFLFVYSLIITFVIVGLCHLGIFYEFNILARWRDTIWLIYWLTISFIEDQGQYEKKIAFKKIK